MVFAIDRALGIEAEFDEKRIVKYKISDEFQKPWRQYEECC